MERVYENRPLCFSGSHERQEPAGRTRGRSLERGQPVGCIKGNPREG